MITFPPTLKPTVPTAATPPPAGSRPVLELRSVSRSVSSQGTEYIWSEGSKKDRWKCLSLGRRSGQGWKSENSTRARALPQRGDRHVEIDGLRPVLATQTCCIIVALDLAFLGRKMIHRVDRQNSLKICLLSQHPMVLEELQRLLSRPGFHPRSHKLDSLTTLAGTNANVPPAGVYVIDAHSPRPVLERIVLAIQKSYPNGHLLFLADHFDHGNAFFLLRLGAKGLLRHADTHDQLQRALRAVASGGFWVPRMLLSSFVDSVLRTSRGRQRTQFSAQLSRRETQVFEALLDNLSNKEIASRLKISERTVKFHVSNVLMKFGVGRRADLILLSYQHRAS